MQHRKQWYRPQKCEEDKGALWLYSSIAWDEDHPERIGLFNKDHGVKQDVRITDLFTPDGKPAGTRVDIFLAYVESF